MEEVIKLITHKNYSDDFIVTSGSREKISPEKFRAINEISGNFLFVDGGNAELIKSPDFSLQFIRILGLCSRNGSKSLNISEFFCFVKTEFSENKKYFRVKNVFLRGKEPLQKDFALEEDFQGPSLAAEFIRRISEISAAAELAKKMGPNEIILLDGTLEASCKTEAEFLLNLHSTANKHGLFLSSLAKTTTMTTARGNSIISLFNSIAPKGRWCYQISKKEIPTVFFAKLHPDSDYIFKFEANSTNETVSQNILGALAKISKDPVFLGYPFGLIEADRLARVSNREKEMLKLEIASKFGNLWKNVEKEETALNAHDVLDSIGKTSFKPLKQ